jgi:hypothetical protein
MNARILELEKGAKARDSKLRKIMLKNQEAEMEVQDYMDKITEWYESKEISFTLYKKKITDWYESKEISLTLYKKK